MNSIVFDLDGTLINSAPDIRDAANRMLLDEGLPVLDQPTITSFIGNGLPNLVGLVMKASGIGMARHDELTTRVMQYYSAGNSALTTLYPGVRDVLETLHENGHALGVCTNKPLAPAHDVLDHFGLSGLISVVLGGDTLPERKPHPAPLLATFEKLGSVGIYVGDSEVDAETAARANIPFALYTQGYRQTPVSDLPHNWSFSDFTALTGIVASSLKEAVE